MTKIVDYRITSFFNRYHQKVLNNPTLYVSGDSTVNVILPSDLLEYANAAAGHTGFGSGARARGIRQQVKNANLAIKDIFNSIDSLITFLESSECNAEAYIQGIKEKHQSVTVKNQSLVSVDNRSADQHFKLLHAKIDINRLVLKFGYDVVLEARKLLTINEFELRFGV